MSPSRYENRRIPESSSAAARDVVRIADLDQDLIILDRNGRVTVALERLAQFLSLETGQQIIVVSPTGGTGNGANGGLKTKSVSVNLPLQGGRRPGLVPVARPRAGRQSIANLPGAIFEGAGTTGLVPDPELEQNWPLRDDGTFQPIVRADMANLLPIDTPDIANDAVTAAKLANCAAAVRPGILVYEGLVGEPSVIKFGAKRWLICKDDNDQPVAVLFSGTTFPTTPVDGQPFYHETHRCSYRFNSTAAGWLGETVYEIEGGDSAGTASGTFLRMYAGGLAAARYTAAIGWRYGFAVKCVGLNVAVAVAQVNAANVDVTDNGTAVAAGGTVTVAAAGSTARDETLLSTTIAADRCIGLVVSGAGPLQPSVIRARFRRFET